MNKKKSKIDSDDGKLKGERSKLVHTMWRDSITPTEWYNNILLYCQHELWST